MLAKDGDKASGDFSLLVRVDGKTQ
jgi:predicted lipoprotein with Yx(FWY)xxD motif